MKRYWIDPIFNYGDFSVKKYAIHEVDEVDGEENDEIIFWEPYEDAGINPAEDDEDTIWNLFDKRCEENLGFVPDYEIG